MRLGLFVLIMTLFVQAACTPRRGWQDAAPSEPNSYRNGYAVDQSLATMSGRQRSFERNFGRP